MKKLFLLALIGLLALPGAYAQTSSASSTTEARNITGFTSIDVTNGIQLTVQVGEPAGVRVEASTAQFRRMTKTVVTNGVLKAFFDYANEPNWKGLVNSKEEFKVYVTMPTAPQSLQGANGAIISLQNINANKLTINLSSGAGIVGAVRAQDLALELRSGTTARLAGTATTLNAQVTGGSTFDSPQLMAEQCTALAKSGSTVRLAVSKSLAATSINEARITYSGAGVLVQQVSEQGGTIRHI
jgi:hypothetical protein